MPDTSEDLLPLGGYEEHRRKLGEERKKEYNDILRQLQLPGRAPQQSAKPDIEFSDFIGGHHSYIVEQQRKRWSDVDIKPYKAAGTSFNSSPAARRKKWIVPDYDHILNQKRLQESNYRRVNNSVYETDLHVQEVSDTMSNLDKQPPQDEHNGGLLKQNKDMVAKRRLATDASPGYCQAATADGRNLRGCPDHNLTFIEPGLDTAGGSILDLHYAMLRQPVRQSLDPPPGLYYQPATYVTDKSAPKPYNFVDEAYNFFASQNPLDPGLSAGPTLHKDSLAHALLNDISLGSRCCLNKSGSGFMQVVPPTGGEDTLGKWHVGSITEQESPDDNVVTSPRVSELVSDSGPCLGARRRHYRTPQAPAVGMEFPSDANHEQNLLQQQVAYRQELARQLLEKEATRLPDLDGQLKCDFKSQKEVNGGPFGNDSFTQLKDHHDSSKSAVCHMTHSYNKNQENDHLSNADSCIDNAGQVVKMSVGERDHITTSETTSGDKTYGRGGNGIFGLPMTDAQKIQAEKYMADLKKQIEEKRIVECKKREQQRLEEEREQKILDDQRIQMQKEYEEEQRRIKEKAEEAKLKNEEIIKAAEERKRETERKDREAEKEREEKQEEKEIELKGRQKEEETRSRAISPLIPTLRDKRTKAPEHVDMGNSLLTTAATVEAATASVSESCSTDDCSVQDSKQGIDTEAIRTQLARMRRYLWNEHKRLQALRNIQEAYLY